MGVTKATYHLQLDPDQVGAYALLPGDPARVALIAARLAAPREVARNREFTTWLGMLDGIPITVTSTGIGGPSAAIAVEELCDLGVRTFVRIGTCGAMQPDQKRSDLVIAQAAVRDEGTTLQYAPAAWPAVADLDVTIALRDAAAGRSVPSRAGVVHSKDSFYGELAPERMPTADRLREHWQALTRLGVLASEMECAALFTVAATRGARAGAVLVVINEAVAELGIAGMPEPRTIPLDDVIGVALDAVRALAGQPNATA